MALILMMLAFYIVSDILFSILFNIVYQNFSPKDLTEKLSQNNIASYNTYVYIIFVISIIFSVLNFIIAMVSLKISLITTKVISKKCFKIEVLFVAAASILAGVISYNSEIIIISILFTIIATSLYTAILI